MESMIDKVRQFIGCDVEAIGVSAFGGGTYKFRGPIKDIVPANHGHFEIVCEWMAKPNHKKPGEWLRHRRNKLRVDPVMFDIQEKNDGRIILRFDMKQQVFTLFPPNGEKLNPKKVSDLIL